MKNSHLKINSIEEGEGFVIINQENKLNRSLLNKNREDTKIYGKKYQEDQKLASRDDQILYLFSDVNIFKYSDRMQDNLVKAW